MPVIEELLKVEGIDVHKRNVHGLTAWEVAKQEGCDDAANRLLHASSA